MNTKASIKESTPVPQLDTEYFDVVTIGAGISGIGAAYNVKSAFPDKSFVVLEAHASFGGTWHRHRYPGIRSDSDLFTFGYKFRPWEGSPIATADQILAYLQAVITENDLERHIRYNTQVLAADWSDAENLWTLRLGDTAAGQERQIRTRFIWSGTGYYDHGKGYTPEWPGMERFAGQIVHPQDWPQDLDLTGKRMVVIGSGATAATIVPAVAEQVAHVTMLQRSPTYFMPRPNRSELAERLRALDLDPAWIHEIVRRDVTRLSNEMTRHMLEKPAEAREQLLATLRELIGEEIVQAHFTPRYDPMRQRPAVIPDGDFFAAIRSGKASVCTDEIAGFEPEGIRLKSGGLLEADLVVTATGFNMNLMGNIAFSINGEPLDFTRTVTWRGTMFTEVPNFVWVFGYFRSSWTLRADIISEFTVRMLQHMQENGFEKVVPVLPAEIGPEALQPFLDPEDFNPGYLMRSLHNLPKRGPGRAWSHSQDYWSERNEFPQIPATVSDLVYR